MTGCVVGADQAEVAERARRLVALGGQDEPGQADPERLPGEWIVGTVDQVVARLQELAQAGVQRVMLQHLVHQDLDMVALLGREVAPAVA